MQNRTKKKERKKREYEEKITTDNCNLLTRKREQRMCTYCIHIDTHTHIYIYKDLFCLSKHFFI
jgi:hypothetical protein